MYRILRRGQSSRCRSTNRQAGLPGFDVLAKTMQLQCLLKRLAARKRHAFHSATGKNPVPNFLYGPILSPVERVSGLIPASRAAQIAALKPNRPLSWTIGGASRQNRMD